MRQRALNEHEANARSALFENYDEDLKQLIASLKGKLEGDVKQLKGGKLASPDEIARPSAEPNSEQKKAALKKVSEELDEAEEIVRLRAKALPSI